MSLSTYDNSNFKGFYQEKKKNIYIYIYIYIGSACHQRMAETIEVE